MYFYSGYTALSIFGAVGMILALILLNELTRRSKIASIAIFIVLPLILTLFVWPKTAAESTWFAWVKTYSALAGVLGFMAFRYFKKLENNKLMILFPSVILIVNIIEAIIRDFEILGMTTEALAAESLQPGIWNIFNGLAGIFLILSMSGFMGVKIAKTKSRDMVWPDMTWFWIIAYTLWNISFCYNTIPVRGFYTGPLVNLTAVFVAFTIQKGSWLQHRAQTLTFIAFFSLTFPRYDLIPAFTIVPTGNKGALLAISAASLAANVAVFVYGMVRAIQQKNHPVTQEIHTELKSVQKVLASNNL